MNAAHFAAATFKIVFLTNYLDTLIDYWRSQCQIIAMEDIVYVIIAVWTSSCVLFWGANGSTVFSNAFHIFNCLSNGRFSELESRVSSTPALCRLV